MLCKRLGDGGFRSKSPDARGRDWASTFSWWEGGGEGNLLLCLPWKKYLWQKRSKWTLKIQKLTMYLVKMQHQIKQWTYILTSIYEMPWKLFQNLNSSIKSSKTIAKSSKRILLNILQSSSISYSYTLIIPYVFSRVFWFACFWLFVYLVLALIRSNRFE